MLGPGLGLGLEDLLALLTLDATKVMQLHYEQRRRLLVQFRLPE